VDFPISSNSIKIDASLFIKTSRELGNPAALALGGKAIRDALASREYFQNP